MPIFPSYISSLEVLPRSYYIQANQKVNETERKPAPWKTPIDPLTGLPIESTTIGSVRPTRNPSSSLTSSLNNKTEELARDMEVLLDNYLNTSLSYNYFVGHWTDGNPLTFRNPGPNEVSREGLLSAQREMTGQSRTLNSILQSATKLTKKFSQMLKQETKGIQLKAISKTDWLSFIDSANQYIDDVYELNQISESLPTIFPAGGAGVPGYINKNYNYNLLNSIVITKPFIESVKSLVSILEDLYKRKSY